MASATSGAPSFGSSSCSPLHTVSPTTLPTASARRKRKVGDLSNESQEAAADQILRLAERDEDRLAKLLPALDLDARIRANEILADHGFYLDSKKTARAREILEAISKPPPARYPLGQFLMLDAPERRPVARTPAPVANAVFCCFHDPTHSNLAPRGRSYAPLTALTTLFTTSAS